MKKVYELLKEADKPLNEFETNFPEYKKQIEGLTKALGRSLCGARLFCTENNILDCANCKGGKLVYKQTATELYRQNVRIGIKNPDKEAEIRELKRKLAKAEHDRDRYKARIKTLTERYGYTTEQEEKK